MSRIPPSGVQAREPGPLPGSSTSHFRHLFVISDSEVDERTGGGYRGVNLWNIRASGKVIGRRSTRRFCREPTGLGFDPRRRRLFISDDDANRIWIDRPGRDGRFGTADDVVRSINVRRTAARTPKTPTFDRSTGHLFFLDGAEPGSTDQSVDGTFGNRNDWVGATISVASVLGTSRPWASTLEEHATRRWRGRADLRDHEGGRVVRVIDVSGIFVLRRTPASHGLRQAMDQGDHLLDRRSRDR